MVKYTVAGKTQFEQPLPDEVRHRNEPSAAGHFFATIGEEPRLVDATGRTGISGIRGVETVEGRDQGKVQAPGEGPRYESVFSKMGMDQLGFAKSPGDRRCRDAGPFEKKFAGMAFKIVSKAMDGKFIEPGQT
jgi:hypothetical protein